MVNLQARGIADSAARFFEEVQLKDRGLWKKFVDVFRIQPDGENRGWRGEYWGKSMRGGALVYSYTKDEELYDVLTETVRDMITVAEPDGRVSSYARDKEFQGWDIWCRKYVILSCEYYLEICKDEDLKKQIIAFIRGCADYIMAHIGSEEGKKEITYASNAWFGLNSSSILEPIVKLYRLTNEKKYLDFATYIIKCGGTRKTNIFKHAFENKLYPYQYGVSKAYEMISCFEGLLEYYYITGVEDCKTAVINFANAVMESEISVIGGSGITHELFDHTYARQTVRQEDNVLQETCVTVTWMKLCERLLKLTGDSRFADSMEKSFYNSYLGVLNTERCIPVSRLPDLEKFGRDVHDDPIMPVDSYSPLVPGKRGQMVGGYQILPDGSYYGCCACIAAAGVGVFLNQMVTADESGITVNFFENGEATVDFDGTTVKIIQETRYPRVGNVKISVKCDSPKTFELRVRIPGWTGKKDGYAVYKKEWTDDMVELDFPMSIRTQLPVIWDEDVVYNSFRLTNAENHFACEQKVFHDPANDNYIALMYGPLTLAADSSLGKSAWSVFDFDPESGELCADNASSFVKFRFVDKDGEEFYLIDYSSAGKKWGSDIAAWIKTK